MHANVKKNIVNDIIPKSNIKCINGITVLIIKPKKLFSQLFGSVKDFKKVTPTTNALTIIFEIINDINGINPENKTNIYINKRIT